MTAFYNNLPSSFVEHLSQPHPVASPWSPSVIFIAYVVFVRVRKPDVKISEINFLSFQDNRTKIVEESKISGLQEDFSRVRCPADCYKQFHCRQAL